MMTEPPPVTPPLAASIERTPQLDARPRTLRNGLLALVAAAVWPILLGSIGWSIGLLSSQAPGDLLFLFGGASIICLLPIIYLMPQQADLLLLILVPVLWLAVVLLPPYVLRRRMGSTLFLCLMLLGISCFSVFQALLGLFMIASKNV